MKCARDNKRETKTKRVKRVILIVLPTPERERETEGRMAPPGQEAAAAEYQDGK